MSKMAATHFQNWLHCVFRIRKIRTPAKIKEESACPLGKLKLFNALKSGNGGRFRSKKNFRPSISAVLVIAMMPTLIASPFRLLTRR